MFPLRTKGGQIVWLANDFLCRVVLKNACNLSSTSTLYHRDLDIGTG